MFKKILIIILLVTSYSLLVTKCNAVEQITITTYYPSPYGSYNQLQTYMLGVGDNDNDGGLDSDDVPTTQGDVWIKGNVGIGTTNPGGGTGSSVLSLANSSAAPTALANTTHLYSSAGEGYWMDAAGSATLQTPHDKVTGEWIFYSKNIRTGRVVRVNMEQLVKEVELLSGKKFMIESFEQPGT